MIMSNSLLNIGLNYIESSDEEDLPITENHNNTKNNILKCVWEECYDDKTGFPYYWNIDTNEVTWKMPNEYLQWLKNHSKSNQKSFPDTEINIADTIQISPTSTSNRSINDTGSNESENNFNIVNDKRKQKKRISFDVLPIRTKVLKLMTIEESDRNAEITNDNELNVNNEQSSSNSNLSPDANQSSEVITDVLKDTIRENFCLIMDKINFFVNNDHSLSPIEIIKVELNTLKAAFDENSLKEEYFSKWLNSVSDHLSELEKAAVPKGWKCHWERDKKVYVYVNLETGETTTDYPLDDNQKIKEENLVNVDTGGNEMDISDEECSSMSPQCNPINSEIDKELALFYTDLANIKQDDEDKSTS